MKPRLNIHVSPELADRVDLAARRPGITKAAIVEAALTGFFSNEQGDVRDAALIRRLDRVSRHLDRLERNLEIETEFLALFVRFFLTVTPPLPEADQEAARAIGSERFDFFLGQLAKRLSGGTSIVRDTLDEITAQDSDFFTAAELDALDAVRADSEGDAQDTAS